MDWIDPSVQIFVFLLLVFSSLLSLVDFICPPPQPPLWFWCGPKQKLVWFCCCPTLSPSSSVIKTRLQRARPSCFGAVSLDLGVGGGGEQGLGPPLSALLRLLNLRASVRTGEPGEHGPLCTRFLTPFLAFGLFFLTLPVKRPPHPHPHPPQGRLQVINTFCCLQQVTHNSDAAPRRLCSAEER